MSTHRIRAPVFVLLYLRIHSELIVAAAAAAAAVEHARVIPGIFPCSDIRQAAKTIFLRFDNRNFIAECFK